MLRTQTADIYRDMHLKLTTGAFPLGAKIMPDPLREDYGCSANTLREVLLRLSSAGLVVFEEQRGFRAPAADLRRLHDLTEFRILLEQEGAARSIRNGGVAWEAHLAAAHHKLAHIEAQIARSGDIRPLLELWSAAEWEFHDSLSAACGSPVLRETFGRIYDQFRQQIITRDSGFGHKRDNVVEHQKIVDAALARDEAACRAAIRDHLSRHLHSG